MNFFNKYKNIILWFFIIGVILIGYYFYKKQNFINFSLNNNIDIYGQGVMASDVFLKDSGVLDINNKSQKDIYVSTIILEIEGISNVERYLDSIVLYNEDLNFKFNSRYRDDDNLALYHVNGDALFVKSEGSSSLVFKFNYDPSLVNRKLTIRKVIYSFDSNVNGIREQNTNFKWALPFLSDKNNDFYAVINKNDFLNNFDDFDFNIDSLDIIGFMANIEGFSDINNFIVKINDDIDLDSRPFNEYYLRPAYVVDKKIFSINGDDFMSLKLNIDSDISGKKINISKIYYSKNGIVGNVLEKNFNLNLDILEK
ncbi:MAG: hypothetical protein COV57_00375 [Candidatus Liptonbacteria bacterium CG11_big_fil_rev_8_21_14_0_20_35_14]|uniref:Uncharacterized protein n=1 Tax=Candidatus Liptonbacteria bacterium CG11_big_fil_rev_8_21_14_0_20_35_14 TaxID=1974634 RepID=A0A2H0NAN0_9BACT|nr:MAG: hypothetical protein COV57_00375 [Candidatus Liptonbacteria bacterium CG11_big_fil_rev_8_21_14_0_20_35_14]